MKSPLSEEPGDGFTLKAHFPVLDKHQMIVALPVQLHPCERPWATGTSQSATPGFLSLRNWDKHYLFELAK